MTAQPALAAADTFESPYQIAAFCAGAAIAALPAPSPGAPRPEPFMLAYVRHWMERAAAEGARRKIDTDAAFAEVNAQTAAIGAAFKVRSAPFYDLTVCDDAKPSVLWTSVPATQDTDRAYTPRSGPIGLDRLADDREVDIYRTSTGRLRPSLADLSAADAFGLDVRILALRFTLAQPAAPDAGSFQLRLGAAFRDRRIGIDALNGEQALAAFKSAVAALEPASAAWGQAQHALCFANFTRLAGDRADNLEQALAACQAALPAFDKAGAREGWADTQLVLGGIWHDRMRGDRGDNIEQAIAADRAALSTMSREKDAGRWAAAQVNLGSHLADRRQGARQDNVEAAIAAYEAAGSVMTRDKAFQAWMVLQNNLAPLYAELSHGDASANQERAIAMLGEVLAAPQGFASLRSSANYQLGQVYRRRTAGEHRANLEMAVRFYRQALLGEPVGERWPIYVGDALGSVLIDLGRYDEASDALKIASRAAEALIGLGLDAAQARDVLSDARDVYTLSAYAAAKRGDPAQALGLLSAGRARLLFTALSADNLDLTPAEMAELRRLRGEIHAREADLEAGAREDPSGAPPPGPALDDLEHMREQAAALYAKGSRAALVQPSAADVVQSGALVAPIITEFGGEILLARAGGQVTAYDAPNVTRAGLDSIFNGLDQAQGDGGWRGALANDRGIETGLAQVQPALGLGLGEAMRRAVEHSGMAYGEPLVIMPDGASAVLPVGLARDPITGRTLIEDYEVSFTPSLAALAASHHRAAVARDQSLGLLRPPSIAALAYAPLEGALVSARFDPSRRHAWDGAEKEALLAALAPLSYWHFATHGGFYWPDPTQSGVLIGEDRSILRLEDLLDPRRRMGEPRLVVLSACDTGLSDVAENPDEFTGLPTGFLFAGAAGVVASLWPVSDLSTTLLMGKFYDLHLGERRTPARALRAAELWLKSASVDDLRAYVDAKRADGALSDAQAETIKAGVAAAGQASAGAPPFAAPRYWGAFVIYGS